jgi:pyrimidine-nucleoside phosphorylase
VEPFRAARSGFIAGIRAWPVGQASMLLGAGRARADSAIDPAAGMVFLKAVGDEVREGDVIAEIHVNAPHAAALPEALAMLADATTFAAKAPVAQSLILERL